MYKATFRIGILDALAYRADFVAGFVSGFSLVLVQFFLWTAIFSNKTQIEGFDLSETITYVALVWVTSGFYATRWQSRDMQDKILDGSISYELVYPVNFQIYTLVTTYAKNTTNFMISGVPALIASVFLFGIESPLPSNFVFFIISMHLSFFISSGISFVLGLFSAYLKNIEGLIQAETFLNTLLSGALVPLAFLPPFLSDFAGLLPFQGIVSTPLLIFLGKLKGVEIFWHITVQFMWGLAVFAFGSLLYSRARKKLEIYGG